MHTVTVRLSGEDFAPAIVRMRDWLKKHRCEPTAYRYDQDDDRSWCRWTSQPIRTRRHLQNTLMVKAAISDPYLGNYPTPSE